MDGKPSLKGAWPGHVNHLNKFCWAPTISLKWLKLQSSNFVHVGYVKSQHMIDKSPLKGRGQSHVTHFKFWGSNDISGTAKAWIVKFCIQVDYQIVAFGRQTTPKKSWSGSHDPFLISTPAIISPERLKWKSLNFLCRWNILSATLQVTGYPLINVVRVTWPVFLNFAPMIQWYLWNW